MILLLEIYWKALLFIVFQKVQKALCRKVFYREAHSKHRDEARHGKAFEGLLARYFK